MAERPSRRRRPIRVQVQTERVEGKIELSEIIARLERGATTSARRAKRDPDVPQEIVDRFTNVSSSPVCGALSSRSTGVASC